MVAYCCSECLFCLFLLSQLELNNIKNCVIWVRMYTYTRLYCITHESSTSNHAAKKSSFLCSTNPTWRMRDGVAKWETWEEILGGSSVCGKQNIKSSFYRARCTSCLGGEKGLTFIMGIKLARYTNLKLICELPVKMSKRLMRDRTNVMSSYFVF